MFKEYKKLNLSEVAEKEMRFWKDEKVFEKSISNRSEDNSFVFYEGPPSANGLPGIHHVMARTIKDIFCRYKTLKGFRVERKAGWDTHGLPVEIGVEKKLGITKEDIGKVISVADYNKACKESVMRYTDVWNDLTEKMGYWVDMEKPYITYTSKYMETVWWLLKQLYDKGLLYKGYSIQPYSPKAGTGLSNHEINQPGARKSITDTTVIAQFKAVTKTLPEKLKNAGEIDLLAWTTTPWTLPSNTALAVGKEIDYVLIKSYNQYTFKPLQVLLAKALVNSAFSGKFFEVSNKEEYIKYNSGDKKIPYLILKELKGEALVGVRYQQLMPYVLPSENPENAFRVVEADFVTTKEGTGIVHIAPTFGADDEKLAKSVKPSIPPMLVRDDKGSLVPLVDLQGRFRKEVKEYAGKYVKNEYYKEGEAPSRSIDVEISIKLKMENKAFKVEKHKHNYPFCWRTEKPILYYPLDAWFVKTSSLNEALVAQNEKINWQPKFTGENRFKNWLAEGKDWNLSRSRFWGTPLPLWCTKDKKETICIGSLSELKAEISKSVEAGWMEKDIYEAFEVENFSDENYELVDLHKDYVDQIILVSPSGKPMYREAELIDVWFDSGAMPYAQWHYPFENRDKIDKQHFFPADFIAEGVDQTRGWFYSLHVIASLVFDSIAFKNVVSNGMVLDHLGRKMSKSVGNTIDPFTTLSNSGPDAIRWYIIGNTNPWESLRFDKKGVEEVKRKFFGTLYNTYSFFALYANLDGFSYEDPEVPLAQRTELDRWILSELNSLIIRVDKYYSHYDATPAVRALSKFTQDALSNWYVRQSRRRFWKGTYNKDKKAAYQTLYKCLITLVKLASPVSPFYTDNIFKDLNEVTQKETAQSVHLTDFPQPIEEEIDQALERKMRLAQDISSLVLSLRAQAKIKVRQPLQRVLIPIDSEEQRNDILAVSDLIKQEVNVKEINLVDDSSNVFVKQVKPNFSVIGKKHGKNTNNIAQAIFGLSREQIREIEKEGKLNLRIQEILVEVLLEDVQISSTNQAGWLAGTEQGISVALDIDITEDLKNEGIARELVNRIQNLRKEAGLEVTDRIDVFLQSNLRMDMAVNSFIDYIQAETLANTLGLEKNLSKGVEVFFDDIQTKLFIQKP